MNSVKHKITQGDFQMNRSFKKPSAQESMFPDINQPKRNNLLKEGDDRSQYSNNRRTNNMDVQSLHSSQSGRLNSIDQASASIYSRQSKNFNPFYPNNKTDAVSSSQHRNSSMGISGSKGAFNYAEVQKKAMEEQKKLKDHKEQLMNEWGFENEVTKKMFEARFNKRNAAKKKKDMTAEEKL